MSLAGISTRCSSLLREVVNQSATETLMDISVGFKFAHQHSLLARTINSDGFWLCREVFIRTPQICDTLQYRAIVVGTHTVSLHGRRQFSHTFLISCMPVSTCCEVLLRLKRGTISMYTHVGIFGQ